MRFNNPFVLQIFILSYERYLPQTTFQQKITTKMKKQPVRIIMYCDIFIFSSIFDSIPERMASIGVSIYLTILSYYKIFDILIAWGTEVGYWDKTALRSSKTLTIPVLRPFDKTPEFKLAHSVELKLYPKRAKDRYLSIAVQQSPLL